MSEPDFTVTYDNAVDFVTTYGEYLSIGTVFVANVRPRELLCPVTVEIVLPCHGTWPIHAKPVLVLEEAGTVMEIVHKPPGFDAALLAYLVRLGRRREVAVMVSDIPAAKQIGDAGYRIVPLTDPETCASAIANAIVPIAALVVPRWMHSTYAVKVRPTRPPEIVLPIPRADDLREIVARIDGLMEPAA